MPCPEEERGGFLFGHDCALVLSGQYVYSISVVDNCQIFGKFEFVCSVGMSWYLLLLL